MMMPANFSAVAEAEMTYVVGGADWSAYLPKKMEAENWSNVATNLINFVGNSYINQYLGKALNNIFSGNYVLGGTLKNISGDAQDAWNNNTWDAAKNEPKAWGLANGLANVGLQTIGVLSAIYTLGGKPVGLSVADSTGKNFF